MRESIDVEVKWDEDLEKGEIIFDVVFLHHFQLSCSFICFIISWGTCPHTPEATPVTVIVTCLHGASNKMYDSIKETVC